MKKIMTFILLILTFLIPFKLCANNNNPIDIAMVYGGVYKDKMVILFHIQSPKDLKTYWQHPGFGGIAPEFAFDKNLNITDINIHYGFPKVTNQAGMINYTLHHNDYIAVTFKPKNLALPINMKGTMTYGYCDNLCKSGTYHFKDQFTLNQHANKIVTQEFFAAQPSPITPEMKITVNNLIADYKPNKNLLISFQINGIKDIDPSNFVYYIDTDFEIKAPIMRKTTSDRYEVALDLFDVYHKPTTLTVMLPNNDQKIVTYQAPLTYKTPPYKAEKR